MDARVAESAVTSQTDSWLQRERVSGRLYDRAAVLIALFLIATLTVSFWLLRRGAEPGTLLKPPVIALMLIALLLPAIALMVLFSRKVAMRRAEQGGLGSGRLHTRLVALFSVIAAVPTVIVAIFASLLLQSGLEFWFSDRARGMLENTSQLAQSAYNSEVNRVGEHAVPMADDLSGALREVSINSPQFDDFFKRQTYYRSLNEAAVIKVGP